MGRNFSLYFFKRTLNTVNFKVCSEYDEFVWCSLFALPYQEIIKQWRCYHYHLRRRPVSSAKSSLCPDNMLYSRDTSHRVVIVRAHHEKKNKKITTKSHWSINVSTGWQNDSTGRQNGSTGWQNVSIGRQLTCYFMAWMTPLMVFRTLSLVINQTKNDLSLCLRLSLSNGFTLFFLSFFFDKPNTVK